MIYLSNLSLYLLLAHFLGDYQFQSEGLSQRKQSRNKKVAREALGIHLGIHGLLLLALLFFIESQAWPSYLLCILLILLAHGLLDLLKTKLSRNLNPKSKLQSVYYLLDQILHVLVLIIASSILTKLQPGIIENTLSRDLLKWALVLVINTKPYNVTFKILFQRFQMPDKDGDGRVEYSKKDLDEETVPGAGGLIGNMERILSAIFLFTNNVAAIGFIYTAKSIARFKHIEESKRFAEYYLIGTLFSILFVVVSYYVIFELVV